MSLLFYSDSEGQLDFCGSKLNSTTNGHKEKYKEWPEETRSKSGADFFLTQSVESLRLSLN